MFELCRSCRRRIQVYGEAGGFVGVYGGESRSTFRCRRRFRRRCRGDLAGFAAGYQRGIKCVQIPTELVGCGGLLGRRQDGGEPNGEGKISSELLHSPLPFTAIRNCFAPWTKGFRRRRRGNRQVRRSHESAAVSPLARPPEVGQRNMEEIVEKVFGTKRRSSKTTNTIGEPSTLNLGHFFGHAIEKARRHTVSHGQPSP